MAGFLRCRAEPLGSGAGCGAGRDRPICCLGRGEAEPKGRGEVLAYLAEYAPPVYDPFCGGGSIPLEAQRLGLRAYGSDLNPVPVLISKALVEIPPKFAGMAPVRPGAERSALDQPWRGAQGLAEDVRHYGHWMRDQAKTRIGQEQGSSTSWPKITARHAASGRRAHHRCRVEGCPCRIDFSRAEAVLIASSGMETSISFLRGCGHVEAVGGLGGAGKSETSYKRCASRKTKLRRAMTAELDIPTQTHLLAEEVDLDQVHAAAVALSKPGATSKAAALPEYARALTNLIHVARGEVDRPEPDRLQALAILARLRKQQNKPFPMQFEADLARPMRSIQTSVRAVPDPKERNYVAQALRLVRFPGQDAYLAELIVGETQAASDALGSATTALLEQAADLSSVFDLVAGALMAQRPDTQDPATTRAKRLSRALKAIRIGLRGVDVRVSQETGARYAHLIKSAIGHQDAERLARIELADETLGLLETWVRPNFSLSRLPDTFAAVSVAQRLFHPARWPDETASVRQSLARLVREAIHILAEAGVTDDRLRQVLVLLLEEQGAKQALSGIARSADGLENHVRHWLETGRAIKTMEGAAVLGETLLQTIDVELAEALRDADGAQSLLKMSQDDIEQELGSSSPPLSLAFRQLTARVDRLCRRVESIGAQRGFELEGTVGDAVTFAPADQTSDQPIAGSRVVRIVSPRVVRRQGAGLEQTVLKATVEPA